MNAIYKWLAAASGLLLVGFLVWYFHTIVFYVLIAAVISLIGKPIVRGIRKLNILGKQIPMWIAAMVALLGVGMVFMSLGWFLVPILVEKVKVLSSFNPEHFGVILKETIKSIDDGINNMIPSVDFSISDALAAQIRPLFSSGIISNTINSLTLFVVDFIMAIFSVCFIAFFFLKDENLFVEGVVMLFPKKYGDNIRRSLNSITNLLIRYFIGICIESAIKLTVVAVALYFIGLDWNTALIIGAITAVLNVIPYIGPIIGGLFAFAIVTFSPPMGTELATLYWQIGLVLLIFQLIDNIILQPYIYSSSVKAEPLEIFIVILMAGYIAGVLGMLLAIPAYTVLRVIAKEFFNKFSLVQRLTEKM
ncbi:Permease [Mucinivorans hirudinis]|uniref:Permease n=1 Tax=Mucinivorans hirudinis TaxID=1433126 RepID=A0A060R9W5_9BACT|nr:Permease [Mucinivorans hirudinis]